MSRIKAILQTIFNISRFYFILKMLNISTFWKKGKYCNFQRGITWIYIISRIGDQINFKSRIELNRKKATLQTPFNISRFYCILNMRKILTFWKSGNNCYLQRGITLLYIISRIGDQINFKPKAVLSRKKSFNLGALT